MKSAGSVLWRSAAVVLLAVAQQGKAFDVAVKPERRIVPQTEVWGATKLSVDHAARFVALWSPAGFEVWSVHHRARMTRHTIETLGLDEPREGASLGIAGLSFVADGTGLLLLANGKWHLFSLLQDRVTISIAREPRAGGNPDDFTADTEDGAMTAFAIAPAAVRLAGGVVVDGVSVVQLSDTSSGERFSYRLPAVARELVWNSTASHAAAFDSFGNLHVLPFDETEPPVQIDRDPEHDIDWWRLALGGRSLFLSADAQTVVTWHPVADSDRALEAIDVESGDVLWSRSAEEIFDADADEAWISSVCHGLTGSDEAVTFTSGEGRIFRVGLRTGEIDVRPAPAEYAQFLSVGAVSGDGRLVIRQDLTGVGLFDPSGAALGALEGGAVNVGVSGYDESTGLVYVSPRTRWAGGFVDENRAFAVDFARAEVYSVDTFPPVAGTIRVAATDRGSPVLRLPDGSPPPFQLPRELSLGRLVPGSGAGFGDRMRVVETPDRYVVFEVESGEEVASWPREKGQRLQLARVLLSRKSVMTVSDDGEVSERSLADIEAVVSQSKVTADVAAALTGLDEVAGGRLVMTTAFGMVMVWGDSVRTLHTGPASLAVSPAGDLIAVGSRTSVKVSRISAEPRVEDPVVETVELDVVGFPMFLRDDRLLVQTADGIELWDPFGGGHLVTVYISADGEAAFVMEDGRYSATPGGLSLFAIVDGADLTTAASLDLENNRPHEVLQAIGEADPAFIDAMTSAYLERVARLTSGSEHGTVPAPRVTLLNPVPITAHGDSVPVWFRVHDGVEPSRVTVVVNGVPTAPALRPEEPARGVFVADVPLFPGSNRIELSVVASEGVSLPRVLTVTSQRRGDVPTTYFLGIGVSDYGDPERDLQYASKDVRDVARALQAVLVDQTRVKLLLDSGATKEEILRARSFLEEAEPMDRIIVYFAGHGFASDLGYAFGSHGVDFDRPADTGVLFSDIETLLDGLFVGSKIIFIDTCHAGEFSPGVSPVAIDRDDARGVRVRGFAPVAEAEEDGVVVEEIFANIDNRVGATTLASSGGGEVSIEDAGLENGLFTYCVIDSLLNGAGDVDENGIINASELLVSVADRVERLSKGIQRPVLRSAPVGYEFPIFEPPEPSVIREGWEDVDFDHAVLSPDGARLLAATSERLLIFDTTTGDRVHTIDRADVFGSTWADSLSPPRWIGNGRAVRMGGLRINAQTGEWALDQRIRPDAHMSHDPTGRWLLTSAQAGGSAIVLLIDETGRVPSRAVLRGVARDIVYDRDADAFTFIADGSLYELHADDASEPIRLRDLVDAEADGGNERHAISAGGGLLLRSSDLAGQARAWAVTARSSGEVITAFESEPLADVVVLTADGPLGTGPFAEIR
ncbi:MAG: caspase family protein [Planctomycetota bacterium]